MMNVHYGKAEPGAAYEPLHTNAKEQANSQVVWRKLPVLARPLAENSLNFFMI